MSKSPNFPQKSVSGPSWSAKFGSPTHRSGPPFLEHLLFFQVYDRVSRCDFDGQPKRGPGAVVAHIGTENPQVDLCAALIAMPQ